MFNYHSAARQFPIALLLLLAQFCTRRLLARRPALFVQLGQPLIAAVGQHFQAFVHLDFALLVEPQVMELSAPLRRANNLSSRAVNNHLRLQRVPPPFAAVVAMLLFFGRSIGVSETSTMMNSIWCSAI